MSVTAACMIGTRGERVALTDVTVDAVVRDLLAEVAMTQVYRNDETCAIEALYTFPLPADAVLLALDVALGNRQLQAVVVEKKTAERRYEEAVADGDTAIMLERPEPGLYTLNVGNLLPGEEARVSVRYALLQRWDRERLRLMIPMTIAPRYGRSPLTPAQAPESALTVEHRFSLQLAITGALVTARVSCPTHAVSTQSTPEGLSLRLQTMQAAMDRDFVLEFHRDGTVPGCAWTDRDGDGLAAIACFQPRVPARDAPRPLDLVVVVDCSGSMQGDAIEQARKALAAILARLVPEDRFELIAFGSQPRALFGRLTQRSPAALAHAGSFVAGLQADLGGTEIGSALRTAFDSFASGARGDIFLVTDGEVADWQGEVEAAVARGHRVFTVGVGSAVSEAFVRGLADATGGACELVTPREGMAERVVRNFERLRTPRTQSVTVQWPAHMRDAASATPKAVFDGDTLQISARAAGTEAVGSVRLDVVFEDGSRVTEVAALAPLPTANPEASHSTTARLAAAQRLAGLPVEAARAVALEYGLISDWTNLLLIVANEAASRPAEFPALRKVPQTLAAGWGGAGSALLRRALVPDAPPRLFRAAYRDASSFENLDDFEVGAGLEAGPEIYARHFEDTSDFAPPDGMSPPTTPRRPVSLSKANPRFGRSAPQSAWHQIAPFLRQEATAEARLEALLLAFERLPAAGKTDTFQCLNALLQHLRGSIADVLRFDVVPAALAGLLLQEMLAASAAQGVLSRPQLRRFARGRRTLAVTTAACGRLRAPQATVAEILADPGLATLLGPAGIATLARSDTRLSELRGMLDVLIGRAQTAASPAANVVAASPASPQPTTA